MRTTKDEIDAWLGQEGVESSSSAAVRDRRCPYAGTLDDRASIMAYSSRANRCFRHGEPRHVSLLRQDEYCLQRNYTACHIFRQPADRRRATQAASQPPNPSRRNEASSQSISLVSWILAAMALLAISAGLILFWLSSTFLN